MCIVKTARIEVYLTKFENAEMYFHRKIPNICIYEWNPYERYTAAGVS